MDPRVALLGVVVISTAAFVIVTPEVLYLILVAMTLLAILHKDALSRYRGGVKGLMGMAALLGTVQGVLTHGDPLLSVELPLLGWVSLLSVEGLMTGIRIVIRVTILLLSTLLFAATVEETSFIRGLRGMRIPVSVVFSINLVLRMIPRIIEDMRDVDLAYRARNISPAGKGYFRRWTRFVSLLKPLLVRYLRSSSDLVLSLELKGFDGKNEIFAEPESLKILDMISLFLLSAGALLLLLHGLGVL